jgi:hypothetical protein
VKKINSSYFFFTLASMKKRRFGKEKHYLTWPDMAMSWSTNRKRNKQSIKPFVMQAINGKKVDCAEQKVESFNLLSRVHPVASKVTE